MATKIANPIYDTVIKYLLQDQRAAKVLIGDLLQREVVSLKISNNEHVSKVKNDISVLRIDFSAEVRTCDGEVENVNIEIQKALLPTEIRRFRRYLASQYSSDNNYIVLSENPLREKNLHMINIYLLGHEVEGLDEVVTYVYPQPFNQNSEQIEMKGDKKVAFINELSHDMIIVQIPKIRKVNLRTKLDELLSIFYQEDIKKTKHEIEVDETKLGDDHKYLVRLLASAYADEDMTKNMEMEDELNVLIDNAVQTNATLKEQVNKQKEQIDSQKEQIDSQKEQIDSQRKQLDSQKKQLSISIKMLRDFGMSDSEIAQRLKIAEADVNDIS